MNFLKFTFILIFLNAIFEFALLTETVQPLVFKFLLFIFDYAEILVLRPMIEIIPLHWPLRHVTFGLPGNSLFLNF